MRFFIIELDGETEQVVTKTTAVRPTHEEVMACNEVHIIRIDEVQCYVMVKDPEVTILHPYQFLKAALERHIIESNLREMKDGDSAHVDAAYFDGASF